MKLLKRFVSWTIWGVILLNVALMTVSYIPQAQNYLGSKVADAIADKLGTQVSIGRVDLGLFNRVIIDDVRIKDQQQQDMLRVKRLSVRLELLPLLDGKISISPTSSCLAHILYYIRRTSAARPIFSSYSTRWHRKIPPVIPHSTCVSTRSSYVAPA